ncbi:hypothetical protein [Flavobacterium sp.]|uniref:hypothetical protein n=1 Tax=Flavobacterium sp. TaxID=239 RepID=UPI0040475AAC
MSFLISTNEIVFNTSEFNDSQQTKILHELAIAFEKGTISNNEIHFEGFKRFRLIDNGSIIIEFAKKKIEVNTELHFHYSFYLIWVVLIFNGIINFDNLSIVIVAFVIGIFIFILSRLFSNWLLNSIVENAIKKCVVVQ